MPNTDPVAGDTCPHCNEAVLEYVPERQPYATEHLICPMCRSTFGIFTDYEVVSVDETAPNDEVLEFKQP